MKSKLSAIIELAKRYDYEERHAHQVECLAGTLFMELEPLHRLTRDDRKSLEFAAILHDIGHYLTARSHHKHVLHMVMIEPLPEFTRSEKLIIANTARYHRKAWPSAGHTCYAILSDKERHIVEMLAPLLRLADGLDRSHQSVVKELKCRVDDENVVLVIDIEGSGNAAAEIESAQRRSELFRAVYNRELKIERASGTISPLVNSFAVNVG